jgi:hypothetical protein
MPIHHICNYPPHLEAVWNHFYCYWIMNGSREPLPHSENYLFTCTNLTFSIKLKETIWDLRFS